MTTQFTDDFNRADGGLGANYSSFATPWQITSNQAGPQATTGLDYVNSVTPGAACWIQFVAVTNVAALDFEGCGLRLDTGALNGYYAAWDTVGGTFQRLDGGVPTQLGVIFTPPANGVTVRLEIRSSLLSLYYNNVLQTTRTDANHAGAGAGFLVGQGSAARIDNLALGTLPTISSPTPSGALGTPTTATIGCTTDDNGGTLYVVVDTASLAGITAAQIVAGQDAGGGPANASGNAVVSTTTPSVGVSGLTEDVTYNYAILQFNGGNSNILTGSFTTASTAVAADTVTASDSAIATTSRVAVAADTATASDSAVATTSRVAVATDTVTASEAAVAEISAGIVAAAEDTATASDSAVAITSRVAVAEDTVTASEAAVAVTSRVAVATDTATASDSAVADVNKVVVAADTVIASDSAVAAIGSQTFNAVAEDTVTASDSAVAVKVVIPPVPQWSSADPVPRREKKRKEELREDLEALIDQFEGKINQVLEKKPEAAQPVREYAKTVVKQAREHIDFVRIEQELVASVTQIVEKAERERKIQRRRREEELLWF